MSLQIYILGSLWEKEIHPYEIKKRITENTSGTVTITDGNLYYNFDALHKKGYIEKVETVPSDNYPDKSFYGITEQGREALKNMIYKSFTAPKDVRSLLAPLFFVRLVDMNRIIFLLQQAVEQREQDLASKRERSSNWTAPDITPEYEECHSFLIRFSLSRRESDLNSLKDLLGVIQRMNNQQ
ncbi:PadR family transcriptional regulator [Paenibacillus sp. WLX1005]|uniref:PadR family transcriptional regulator n=1 Tax=unclassified Paenibacillus TaxID=185978 RepID=UPI0039840BDF